MASRLALLAQFERGFTRGKNFVLLLLGYTLFAVWQSGKGDPSTRLLVFGAALCAVPILLVKRPLAFAGLLMSSVLAIAGTQSRGALFLLTVAALCACADAFHTLESIEAERWVWGTPIGPSKLFAILVAAACAVLVLTKDEHVWARLAPAGLGFGLLIVGALSRLRRSALDLDVTVRARAAFVLFGLGAGLALLRASIAPGSGVEVTVLCFVCAFAIPLLQLPALALSKLTKRLMILVGLGVPLASISAILAGNVAFIHGAATDAGALFPTQMLGVSPVTSAIVCVGIFAALGLGLATPRLERQLLSDRGKLLDAIETAVDRVSKSRPEESVRAVLSALREPYEPTVRVCSMWTVEPPARLHVDAAGYQQTKEMRLPPGLIERLLNEPRNILRSEVLEELEIRFADCRGIGQWARDLDAHAMILISLDGVPEGVLVVPRYERTESLSLEEVEALRALGDHLAAALSLYGQRGRAFLREQELKARLEKLTDESTRKEHEALHIHERHVATTTRLARPAEVGFYSAVAQLAQQTLERRMKVMATTIVETPSGADPVPIIARSVLCGPRATMPFVVVDGTSTLEHDPEAWRAPTRSPLALATGGVLCVLDVCALPGEVQTLLAQAHREKRAPWEQGDALDFQLVVTMPRPTEEHALRLMNALHERLQNALEEPVRLPRLQERADDLRMILLDRLAREGLRVRGEPVGLDSAAFALLVECVWDGEDAELNGVVARLVRSNKGPVVTADDVRALVSERQ
jgi:hypothetical protein